MRRADWPGVVTLATFVAAFGLLAVGWPYFWIAFPIGFGGLLPTAVAAVERLLETESVDTDPGGRDTDQQIERAYDESQDRTEPDPLPERE